MFTNWSAIDYFNEMYNFLYNSDVNYSYNLFDNSFIVFNVKYVFSARIFTNTDVIILFHPLDYNSDMFEERKGNPMCFIKVLENVFQSIKLMLNEYPSLNRIVFSVNNQKLKNICDMMDKTIQKRFPDWNLEGAEIGNHGKKNYIYVRNSND